MEQSPRSEGQEIHPPPPPNPVVTFIIYNTQPMVATLSQTNPIYDLRI
jgi:hypothetical protein